MNFKIMAATLGVIAALSVPVLVAANSPGNTAGAQGSGAGTCVCAGDCTHDQVRLGDGSCGGDGTGNRVQLRTQSRLQTRDCTQSQAGVCTQTQESAQEQLGDQTSVKNADCTQEQLRTRDCDQTRDGDQDQTRTQQRLGTGK